MPLPAHESWSNTGGYGFSARQTALPSTLLLYAQRCGHFGGLAMGLKAHKTRFPIGLRSTQTAGLSLALPVVEEAPLLFSRFTGVDRCQKPRSNISEHFPCTPVKNPTPRPDPAPSPSTRPRLMYL